MIDIMIDNDENALVGTWAIIHTDGTPTYIKCERTGDPEKSEPNLIEDTDDFPAIIFEYMDGRIRVFPLYTMIEASFVPEGEDDE